MVGMFRCKIHRVIDGDTVKVSILYGELPLCISVRVVGIDAPEIHTKNDIEKRAGLAVKKVVEKLLKPDQFCAVELKGWDKFARVLGDFRVYETVTSKNTGKGRRTSVREIWLSQFLLEKAMVVKYEGKAKEEWKAEQLEEIERVSQAYCLTAIAGGGSAYAPREVEA
jgi:endonuclease YncB( thermonuclease family)